jgi:hypothetical protein
MPVLAFLNFEEVWIHTLANILYYIFGQKNLNWNVGIHMNI